MRTIAYVGNKNRYDYSVKIKTASVNRTITFDLMNTSEEQITQDLLNADSLTVIGDWWELPEDARDIIGLARIIGKPISYYNDVSEDFLKTCTINFCMKIVDGIMSELLTGDND